MKVSIILVVMGAFVVCTMAFRNRCKKAEDCEADECCVNYAIVSFLGGQCQKIRDEGESCTPILRESEQDPDQHNFQCPCKKGLECEATQQIKIGDSIIKHKPECVKPGAVRTEADSS